MGNYRWAAKGCPRGVTEDRTGKANNHKKEPQEKAKQTG